MEYKNACWKHTNTISNQRTTEYGIWRRMIFLGYHLEIIFFLPAQPLPEKHSLFEQIDRYDKRFIEGRMQLLKRFLNRVADHPLLSRDHRFKGFLVEPQNVS